MIRDRERKVYRPSGLDSGHTDTGITGYRFRRKRPLRRRDRCSTDHLVESRISDLA